jgi:hypothetical protein
MGLEKEPVAAPSAGTPARLVLLTELISGSTKEGTPVALFLEEDLKTSQGVVLPKGTPVRGEVIWSRGEGSLDGMIRRPSRLKIRLEPVASPHGYTVAFGEKQGVAEYEFNRGNTGTVTKPIPDEIDEEADRVLTELRQKLSEQGTLTDEDLRAVTAKFRDEMRLDATQKLVDRSEVSKVNQLLRTMKSNAGAQDLVTGEFALAVAAVSELAGLAQRAGQRLDRMLSGRNIRAYVGTKVPVQVVDAR